MCGPVVFEDGTAGCAVVFVLASATDGPPGAARATAELTRALRNAGHFTVAVLTLPFEFEGQKKNEAGCVFVICCYWHFCGSIRTCCEANPLLLLFGGTHTGLHVDKTLHEIDNNNQRNPQQHSNLQDQIPLVLQL